MHQDLDDAIEGAFKGERQLAGGPKQARVDEQKGGVRVDPALQRSLNECWTYFLFPFRKRLARPTKPLPRRSMVPGSGIGALVNGRST